MASSRKPTVAVQQGVTVISLGPEFASLDEHGLDDVRESILNIVGAAEPPLAVLDMPHTNFFGSAFIEILFKAWKRLHARQGEFALSGLTPYCHEVIQITNLDRLWKVVPTVSEGVSLLAKSKAAQPS